MASDDRHDRPRPDDRGPEEAPPTLRDSRTPSSTGSRAPSGIRLKQRDILGGRFRIVRFIARGGMGSIYEAEDLELGGRVAIKTLRPDITQDDEVLARFRREIQLARKVTHPNVCRIFDLFHHRVAGETEEDDDEIVFLVMELLDGQTLADRIKTKGPLTTKEALPIVVQIASALDAAHHASIVHRDFKSANIILVPTEDPAVPRAVITDFGIARSLAVSDGEMSELTAAGGVLGTPAYVAPEQLTGGPITPAVDVYSFGVVLYELVTGHRPFSGDSPFAMAAKRLREAPVPPRARVKDLDPRWNDVILKCLEREKERRFASAGDVAAALQSSGALPRAGLSNPRHRQAVLAALVLAVVIAVVLGVRAVRQRAARDLSSRVETAQVTNSAGRDLFPAFSPDGTAIAYASDRTGPFEIYIRPFASGAHELALTSDGQENIEPAYSPDGRLIAYHSKKRGGIWVVPSLGGAPRQLTDTGTRPTFTPDGNEVFYQSGPATDLSPASFGPMPPSVIMSVPVQGGRPRARTRPGTPAGGHGSPAITPDGKRMAFVAFSPEKTDLWVSALDGSELRELPSPMVHCYDPVFSADGRFLYFASVSTERHANLYRVGFDPAKGTFAGTPTFIRSVELAIPRHLSVAKSGDKLTYTALTLTSNLWSLEVDPKTGEPTGTPEPVTREIARNSRPAFSPDGTKIAFVKWQRGTNMDIWTMDANGGNERQITSDPTEDYLPSWYDGGRRLAYLSRRSGTIQIWSADLTTGRESRLLDVGPDIDNPRLSPDGKWVAFNSKRGGGTLNVWLAPVSGGAPKQLTFDKELAGFPCWSPDGKWLAVQVARGETRQVAIVPREGGEMKILTHADGQSWSDAFSPDGDKIAFAGLRGGLWNLYWVSRSTLSEKQLTFFKTPNSYVRYPAFSPAGDRLVFEYAENTGNVWLLTGL